MIQPSSLPFEMMAGWIFSAERSCEIVAFQSGSMPRALMTASKSAPAAERMP